MKIENYRPIGKGSIIASFDLEIPKMGIKICNMTLFQKDSRKWVSFPSRQYEKDGVKKYSSYIYFLNKDHQDPFNRMVLLAIEEQVKTSQELPPNDETSEIPF